MAEPTIDLREYYRALREADRMLADERDRRYTEVSAEREKALKIKEAADRDALHLAREIQTYKDEQANELREQINRERNLYASKDDLTNVAEKLEAAIKPALDNLAAQQGRSLGFDNQRAILASIGTVILVMLAVVAFVIARTNGRG
jgi:CHASE3 domain sensor protein